MMSPDPTASTTTVSPFRVTTEFWKSLPQMPTSEYPGTEGFIDDVYANPDGSEMSAGYFGLRHTDAPLDYLYEYDEMKVVLDGEFLLENLDTGQTEVAKPNDAIFFPKGSRIRFTTPAGALAFYVGHRSFAP
ncbi:ethanolamine utilization protein [Rhodococcus pseudokoreensis]|uniref:Ethanolamine utilization protein n=1 Tax=Rhodococcus pseudokoreensis TaxID=2811421 RepID=A0A974W7L3_9NOCA|nr:ethanolamine utilization protein [Rhodococcus pseudokoreensis]QSE92611.1 ethanolamine utilization protein [Rhodococcus pseudokoreensis]